MQEDTKRIMESIGLLIIAIVIAIFSAWRG